MHSIYGLSCQMAWRWPVCRSKHVACNKTTLKSVVPDVLLFYFISTILAHRDVFRHIVVAAVVIIIIIIITMIPMISSGVSQW